jgi:hypothetical protein
MSKERKKTNVIARLSRYPVRLVDLKPAIDDMTEQELTALYDLLCHLDNKISRLKHKVHRGY